MNLSFFSDTGTKVAYAAWFTAAGVLGLLWWADAGPGVWISDYQVRSLGYYSRRLTALLLLLGTAPVWLLVGGLFDLITRQGPFEHLRERPRRRRRRRDRDDDDN